MHRNRCESVGYDWHSSGGEKQHIGGCLVSGSSVLPLQGNGIRITRSGRAVLSVDEVTVGNAPCTAIIGPNGAGKSLLLRTLGGLLEPDSGSVTWAGEPALPLKGSLTPAMRDRRLAVGFVMQRPSLLARTAQANLEFALRARGLAGKAASARALDALEVAGLSSIADTPAHRLSSGEQQRLALARALALEPAILLLDEPTANVDPVSTAPIETMLIQAAAAGCRIVIVSHDLNQVKRLADEVLMMHQGVVVEQQAVTPFFDAPNSDPAKRWLAGELLV